MSFLQNEISSCCFSIKSNISTSKSCSFWVVILQQTFWFLCFQQKQYNKNSIISRLKFGSKSENFYDCFIFLVKIMTKNHDFEKFETLLFMKKLWHLWNLPQKVLVLGKYDEKSSFCEICDLKTKMCEWHKVRILC